MKHLFTCLFIGYSLCLIANNGIDSVAVEIELQENVWHIKQSIFITITDSGDDFLLRALPSKDSQIFIDTIHIDQKRTSFETLDMTPTLNFRFSVSPENKVVDIYYLLTETGDEIAIPIFFTSISAINSEFNFFTASILRTIDQHYVVIFPKVPIKEIERGMHKTTSFRLPATPSLIRLKKLKSYEDNTTIQWIDWGVGLVFLMIGILLWINRKKLAYG